MRIIYALPPQVTASGGVKVSYRHSELLNQMGVESYIYHPADEKFSCQWFEHKAKFISTGELNPKTDLIVIPEIWASVWVERLKSMGFKVCIFVQNAYLTFANMNQDDPMALEKAYKQADLVTVISEDSMMYMQDLCGVDPAKMVRQIYSVNTQLFRPGTKEKKITYMPRKMPEHTARVIPALERKLSSRWKIVPIDGKNERDVAKELSSSLIFLAFSGFEGLPVPPVEAALAGNAVIGYHGEGGREYWWRPTFTEVSVGDIQSFVLRVEEKISEMESGQLELGRMNEIIQRVSQIFSPEAERQMVENFRVTSRELYL